VRACFSGAAHVPHQCPPACNGASWCDAQDILNVVVACVLFLIYGLLWRLVQQVLGCVVRIAVADAEEEVPSLPHLGHICCCCCCSLLLLLFLMLLWWCTGVIFQAVTLYHLAHSM
jgi:hypothetical protein